MYLPTFYKLFYEKLFWGIRRYSMVAVPVSFWRTYLIYGSRLGDVPIAVQHRLHGLLPSQAWSRTKDHRGVIQSLSINITILL